MIWLAVVVLLGAAGLLLVHQFRHKRGQQWINERLLHGSSEPNHDLSQSLSAFGNRSWLQRYLAMDVETRLLLKRAGFDNSYHQAIFFFSQIATPVLFCLLVLLSHNSQEQGFSHPAVALLIAAGIGYLLPKRVLAKFANNRQARLIDEVSIFVPLIRILFSAGLTVEQSIRILSQQGNEVLPILSERLRLVLVRVDSGLELAEELEKLAKQLEIDELSDCLAVLRQLISQGGGAMKSLQDLKRLMDDRRLTRLQERISKMAAKMSVVMMLFLFPALLIVLAGPGMRAIGRAMGGM